MNYLVRFVLSVTYFLFFFVVVKLNKTINLSYSRDAKWFSVNWLPVRTPVTGLSLRKSGLHILVECNHFMSGRFKFNLMMWKSKANDFFASVHDMTSTNGCQMSLLYLYYFQLPVLLLLFCCLLGSHTPNQFQNALESDVTWRGKPCCWISVSMLKG